MKNQHQKITGCNIICISNLAADIISIILTVTVIISALGQLGGFWDIPLPVTFIGLLFGLLNPKFKELCLNKVAVVSPDDYVVDLQTTLRHALAENPSSNVFRIQCSGIIEYSFNEHHPYNIVLLDSLCISIINEGKAAELVGCKGDEPTYIQLIEL